jgi:hypothetical protein
VAPFADEIPAFSRGTLSVDELHAFSRGSLSAEEVDVLFCALPLCRRARRTTARLVL